MPHAGGERRKDREVGAAFALDADLAGFDALANFVVGNEGAWWRRAAVFQRGDLLRAPGFVLRRRSGVVTVAIDDHGVKTRWCPCECLSVLARPYLSVLCVRYLRCFVGHGAQMRGAGSPVASEAASSSAGVTRITSAMIVATTRNAAIVSRASLKLPVALRTSPMLQGPTRPPNCAMVLISAIVAAPAAPVLNDDARLQNSGLPA